VNRINQVFLRKPGLHFIPFITAGDPDSETTVEMALMLQDLGASVIELGVPYSDPLADGPVIQRASIRALESGMSLEKAMHLVPVMREKGLDIPVIIFTYYNPLLQLTEDRFFRKAEACDIDGLLVPDLPFEESVSLRRRCREAGVKYISLVAPTTSMKRLAGIGREAEGFLYCVSSLGVTGERDHFHPDVHRFLARVRSASHIPIAVGFGISSRRQIEALRGTVDGFIVGSAIVKEMEARIERLRERDARRAAVEEIRQALTARFFEGASQGERS
jgi:tryptophan synthase alpha chain